MALILLLHVKEGLESVEEWILWECYYMVNKRWKYVLSDLVVITQGLASDIVLVSLICIHMYST